LQDLDVEANVILPHDLVASTIRAVSHKRLQCYLRRAKTWHWGCSGFSSTCQAWSRPGRHQWTFVWYVRLNWGWAPALQLRVPLEVSQSAPVRVTPSRVHLICLVVRFPLMQGTYSKLILEDLDSRGSISVGPLNSAEWFTMPIAVWYVTKATAEVQQGAEARSPCREQHWRKIRMQPQPLNKSRYGTFKTFRLKWHRLPVLLA